MNNVHYWRWVSCWFTQPFLAVASYRFNRSLYLLVGQSWSILRLFLSPIRLLISPWGGRTEIHYRADIGKGLLILHPSVGIVVSGKAIIGENLTLTGGNIIGAKGKLESGDLMIGNNCSLGANAVILGPVSIGNDVRIGAGAVVIHDAPDNAVLVGVPAKNVNELQSRFIN